MPTATRPRDGALRRLSDHVAVRVALMGLALMSVPWRHPRSVLAESLPPPAPATASARRRPRIVNGVVTPSYPATGALLFREDRSDPGALSEGCTGTLIGCQIVLTAAHCVCPDDIDTATACLAAGLEEPSNVTLFLQHAGFFAVSSIAINPAYEFAVASDTALIKLATPVSGIAPARINTTARPPFGTMGTIVGFGISVDREVDSGVKRAGKVVTATCDEPISNSTHVCWNFVQPVGPLGEDSNTCEGDSGGPLFIDFGSGDRLAGITSGGDPGCRPNSFSWDADVFYERSWIQTEAGTDLDNESCGDISPVGSADAQVDATAGTVDAGHSEGRSTVQVRPGTNLLRVALNGEDEDASVRPSAVNDFDLYIRAGSPPTRTTYDCRDVRSAPYGFCEVTAPAAGTWHVLVDRVKGGGTYQVTATTFGATAVCTGDCNADGEVTVDELVRGVNIALGSSPLEQCASFDTNGDGEVTVDELVRGVNGALAGCAGE